MLQAHQKSISWVQNCMAISSKSCICLSLLGSCSQQLAIELLTWILYGNHHILQCCKVLADGRNCIFIP